jgi:hypothetical protein
MRQPGSLTLWKVWLKQATGLYFTSTSCNGVVWECQQGLARQKIYFPCAGLVPNCAVFFCQSSLAYLNGSWSLPVSLESHIHICTEHRATPVTCTCLQCWLQKPFWLRRLPGPFSRD